MSVAKWHARVFAAAAGRQTPMMMIKVLRLTQARNHPPLPPPHPQSA